MGHCYNANVWDIVTMLMYGTLLKCECMGHCYNANVWDTVTMLMYETLLKC